MADPQSVRIRLHSTLTDRVGCQAEFTVEGNSLYTCLEDLARQHTELGKLIWREDADHDAGIRINPILLFFLGDTQITPQNFHTALPATHTSVIDIIPAISGG